MNIIEAIKSRKTCKVYDSTKSFTQQQIKDIKDLLRYSPSSSNSQPWHFFLIESNEAKEKILPGIMEFNRPKIKDSCLTVVFTVKNKLDEAHGELVTTQEEKDGRFIDESAKKGVNNGRQTFISLNSDTPEHLQKWCEKQAYIALGTLLLGAEALKINATPIEGIHADELNKILELDKQGLHSIVVVTLGYASDDDYNAKLPKSRFDEEQIFTTL